MPRYWAIRTDQERADRLWAEVLAGRLRQGWGYQPEQDLELIADLKRRGRALTNDQRNTWRGNRRLLSTEPGEVRRGDIVVAPNLPRRGECAILRVTGEYRYEISDIPNAVWDGPDYGHILPVDVIAAPIDRSDRAISDRLRSALRPPMRMWSLDHVADDIEALIRERS